MYIALVGNVASGFRAVGPYPTFGAALLDHCGKDTFILELVPPERAAVASTPQGDLARSEQPTP